jgi:hypothetical protein
MAYRNHLLGLFPTLLGVLLAGLTAAAQQQTAPLFPPPAPVFSTIPANGDVDPYGVAFAPAQLSAGYVLQPNDLLVTNFNNNQNLQGTGTTIVRVSTGGTLSLFYQGAPSTLGLTSAIGVVKRGFVFVGNLPTADGTPATATAGSVLVLDGNGHLVMNITSPLIKGPWGMAVQDGGSGAHVYVSNVLNGTIARLDFAFSASAPYTVTLSRIVEIGSGFNYLQSPAALELGPSGLAYDAVHDTLYIASSVDNAVYSLTGVKAAKSSLGSGTLVFRDLVHLHGPTQMAFSPNGHLLVANSDGSNVDPNQPSELVEFTTAGTFVSQFSVDPNNGGAFGVGVAPLGTSAFRIAAVDDNQNQVKVWTEVVH